MKKINLKAVLPHLICLVALYLVTILYFQPEFFDDKRLAKDDIMRYEGGSKEIHDYNKTHDEPTLWTGRMFGGMPVFMLYVPYPDQPIAAIDKVFKGLFFLKKDAHILIMLLLCSYFALSLIGVKPYSAAFVAAAFGFSTYNLILIDVGHLTKAWAIAYSPIVLAGMYLVFQGKHKIIGAAVFALALALQIRANHIQIPYYLAFVGVFYALSHAVFNRQKVKDVGIAFALLALGAALAVGANASRLMVTAEYADYTQRGKSEITEVESKQQIGKSGLDKDYAFNWSEGIGETFTLLIPSIYGGSNNEKLNAKAAFAQLAKQGNSDEPIQVPFMYWGEQPFTNAPIYAGAIVCFLFVFALLYLDKQYTYWILGSFVWLMMIAWGKNWAWFNYFMFDNFPMFNKFRGVTMALGVCVMLMMLLSGMLLKKLESENIDFKTIQRKFFIAFALTGGLSLLLYVFAGMLNFSKPDEAAELMEMFKVDENTVGMIGEAIRADRKAMMRGDAIRSFFFITAAALALFFYFKQKLSAVYAFLIVGSLSFVDVWLVGKRYVNESNFKLTGTQSGHEATEADLFILKDKELGYRVLNPNNTFQEAETSYHHRSIGGYFSAKLRRYQDLINKQLSGEIYGVMTDLQKGNADFRKYRVLNMLNTRYIKAAEEEKYVIKNPEAYGAAWFVDELKTVQSPEEEYNALDTLNSRNIAIVDATKFKAQPKRFDAAGASVKLTFYEPNWLKYECESTKGGFVVFSEIYYPNDWQASIDGKPVDHWRVDYVLRGLEVPAGKHTVEFRYQSATYQTGNLITQTSAIAIFLFLLAGTFVWYRTKDDQTAA